jgi:hypothetical protein
VNVNYLPDDGHKWPEIAVKKKKHYKFVPFIQELCRH